MGDNVFLYRHIDSRVFAEAWTVQKEKLKKHLIVISENALHRTALHRGANSTDDADRVVSPIDEVSDQDDKHSVFEAVVNLLEYRLERV